jgi:peptide/nickel transport system substrate-binding protein
MKKHFKLLSILMAVVILLSACKTDKPSSDIVIKDTVRDDLIIAIDRDPSNLCAGFAASTIVSFCSRQFYDTLVVKDQNGEYTPSLAISWEYVNDGKDIVFEIRDDVYFHNGEKMMVDDVVFSYNAIIKAGFADCATSAMDHMEKIDDSHVILYFTSPYGPALECVSTDYMMIFSQTYYEKNPDFFQRNPMGTGAYKFVDWKTGDKIIMTANDDYFKGTPPIKNVTLKIFTDTSIATMALENGEIDAHISPPTTDAERLRNNSNINLSSAPSATITWVYFNMDSIFADEKLRLAVAHAIDKEAVLIGAIDGEGELVNSICPNFFFGVDRNYEPPGYDPGLSKQLLAEAGYSDGLDLEIDVSSVRNYYMPVEIIQAQLQDVGIRCTVKKIDSNAWFNDVFKGATYSWNIASFTCSVMDFDENYPLYRGDQGQNFGKVNFPDLNDAFDRNRFSIDLAEREKACNDICRIMGDRAICVPLYAINNILATDKDLKGATAHATNDYCIFDWSW